MSISSAMANGLTPSERGVRVIADTPFEVSGEVSAPLCQINENKAIDIEFDNVVIQQINGINFAKTVPFNITCSDGFSGEVDLMIKANSSSFNSDAIATNDSNLAIQLLINEKVQILNALQPINWRESMELKAVPIKNTLINPSAGDFTAVATLSVEVH
ncbi:fimbrial protein [Pantoea sp. SOD02]|uniref:fimbrial protein n=1 Tax=Pantoea sp. SOD02 TaxID=2970818 RepID=UPI002158075E|nr:fimbrial protein [Pantoea sp. SOD02]UVC29324.1 fimbrial protein [Pantoea sp. SOD02]